MSVFHFLNVGLGDCSVIQHDSGRVTVIDVNRASLTPSGSRSLIPEILAQYDESSGVNGDFKQRDHPVNPIEYLRKLSVSSIFRFILTHPDMDHMSGIQNLFSAFPVWNFWDIDNAIVKTGFGFGASSSDWTFYTKHLRDAGAGSKAKRMLLYAGDTGSAWNCNDDGSVGGDRLDILAPTPGLVADAKATDNYNDASYVVLHRTNAGRILICGDSHDATWDHILRNHRSDVEDVELLIAPHHGRDSGRSYDFLDVLKPKVTLFGYAPSEHLAYGPWSRRGLFYITNNQANCVVVNANGPQMQVFVTHRPFANSLNQHAPYEPAHDAYYVGYIERTPPKPLPSLASLLYPTGSGSCR